MDFAQFRSMLLHTAGVTYVGPHRACVIGVETDAHAVQLRRFVDPRISIVVTGVLWQTVEKHPGVVAYEKTMEKP